jgi:hypothetical protein
MHSPTSIDSRRSSTSNPPSLQQSSQRESSPERSLLSRHPKLGRPISTREEYRQIVMQVLGGTYVFQYRYSSQGQTAGRVLVHVETERTSEKLVNQRLAYVAVSRGQYDAQLYTDEKVRLARALRRDVSHRSALGTASAPCVGRALSAGHPAQRERQGGEKRRPA